MFFFRYLFLCWIRLLDFQGENWLLPSLFLSGNVLYIITWKYLLLAYFHCTCSYQPVGVISLNHIFGTRGRSRGISESLRAIKKI